MVRFRRAQNAVAFLDFIITPIFGYSFSALAISTSATTSSGTTRPDRYIISDIGAVSIVSTSSPSRDTLAVDLTRAISSVAVP
jgi:hypothetical protein